MTVETDFAPGILVKAAQDVRLLIAHVTREGKAFDASQLTKLLGYADKTKSRLTADEEGEFWKLYADLIVLALPARIDSLYFADYANALGATGFKPDDAIYSGLKKHQEKMSDEEFVNMLKKEVHPSVANVYLQWNKVD